MLAAAAGNVALVEALLRRGADVEAVDNHGRLAFHHVLLRAFTDAAYARGPFERLYALLAPQAVDLMVDERLVKLDAHLIEYFVFNALVALLQLRLNYPHGYQVGFRVDDLLGPLEAFPEAVFPEQRRRRGYLSGVLARNEVTRDYAYNRKLFVRVGHGFYVPNPSLSVRAGDGWMPLYDRLYPPEIDRHTRTALWHPGRRRLPGTLRPRSRRRAASALRKTRHRTSGAGERSGGVGRRLRAAPRRTHNSLRSGNLLARSVPMRVKPSARLTLHDRLSRLTFVRPRSSSARPARRGSPRAARSRSTCRRRCSSRRSVSGSLFPRRRSRSWST